MMSPGVGMGGGAMPSAGWGDGGGVLVIFPLNRRGDGGGRGGASGEGGVGGGGGGGGGDGGGIGGKGGDGEGGGIGAEHWQVSRLGSSGEMRSSQPADKHCIRGVNREQTRTRRGHPPGGFGGAQGNSSNVMYPQLREIRRIALALC